MRNMHAHLLSTTLFLSIGSLSFAAEKPATKPAPFLSGKVATSTLPESAVPGSTPERTAALRRLTSVQKANLVKVTQKLAASRYRLASTAPVVSASAHYVRDDLFGKAVRGVVSLRGLPVGAPSFTRRAGKGSKKPAGMPYPSIAYSGPDEDGDSLPDDFETAVGDGFTPLYGVSSGEDGGTGFARFADSNPLNIIENLPAVPPASHYRVTPVGFAYDSYGQQYGFLQIDYLTIWNRDDGLDVGGDCRFFASVLGGLTGYALTEAIDGAGAHDIDQERSAALVAAPVSAPFQYSSDPDAYQAYDFYTAAHEGTFFDHSGYVPLSQTVPIYNHLNLALSRSKHSTYTFDPDNLPLFPDWVINSTYATIDALYYYYEFDYYQYLIYLGMADVVFFSCVVEHFDNQGGAYAMPRINVGELSHTLNGSSFIYDPRVQGKLTPLLWVIQ